MKLAFTVHGKPQPQGSLKAFVPKGSNSAILTSDNTNLKPWRQDVALSALSAGCRTPTKEAVAMRMKFYFAKPPSAPKRVTEKLTKPDLDKLARGVLDSLTGIAFVDDSQVTTIHCSKRFGLPERAEIEIHTVTSEDADQPFQYLPGEDPESQCACPDCRRAREVGV